MAPVEKIMPYHITILEAPPALELQYIGRLAAAELAASVKDAMAMAEKHQRTRILTDCSQMEGGHGVFDLFEGVMQIHDNLVGTPFREAIVQANDPKAAELVRFWETACKNRGLNVQVFPTRQAATAWLHA